MLPPPGPYYLYCEGHIVSALYISGRIYYIIYVIRYGSVMASRPQCPYCKYKHCKEVVAMLPEQVRKDVSVKRWLRMPSAETDARHVLEAWEREPHPDDKPSPIPGESVYCGQWKDVTPRYKAAWEVEMAKNELERAKREALRKERLEQEAGRSALDPPIGRGRRHS